MASSVGGFEGGFFCFAASCVTPELVLLGFVHAAQLGLIRPEEFRKNAVKFGWELWEAKPESPASDDATVTRSN